MDFIILILIAVDLLTKQIFKTIQNYGAAFGLLEGFNWLFVIISFLVIILLIRYRKTVNRYGFYFLMAGTMGNLIDRIVFGYVRDFISISIWPSFNLADVFNVIGVILILIYSKKPFKKSLYGKI